MTQNRVTGVSYTTTLLPVAAGGSFDDSLSTDMLLVPAGWGAGVHTVNLYGTNLGQQEPADGDRVIIADPSGLLSAGSPLVIVGSLLGVGRQISNGGLAVDSITLSFAGSNVQLTFSSHTNMWEATAASSGTSGSTFEEVEFPADLTALGSGAFPDSMPIFVSSLLVDWTLSKTDTQTPDGITVVATDLGPGFGNYLRVPQAVPQWSAQDVWGINATTGLDTNLGTPGAPLKTMAEWCRRMRSMTNRVAYTLLLQTDIPGADLFVPSGWNQSQGPFDGGGIAVVGQRTTLVAGLPVTAATDTNVFVGSGLQATLTSGAFVWGPHVGKLVVSSPSGTTATITADLGAGVARLGGWDLGAPSPGDTVDIVQYTSFGPELANLGSNGEIDFSNCFFPTVGGQMNVLDGPRVAFAYCRFERDYSFGDALGGRVQMVNCSWLNQPEVNMHGGQQLLVGCSFIGTDLRLSSPSTAIIGGLAMQGCEFKADTGAVGHCVGFPTNVGVFDSPADGVELTTDSKIVAGGFGPVFYGSGNGGFGVNIHDGASILAVGQSPSITGAGGDVQVDGAATAIPPLVAGAVVPAASALATWADLAAAPFNGDVVNYTKLTRIVTA